MATGDLSWIQAQEALRRVEAALTQGRADLDAAKALGILLDRMR